MGCPGHQKKMMLAVDRLRKSVSGGGGLRRPSTTSTPPQSHVIPAVEPRASCLVRKPSNAHSVTVNGSSTPTRQAQPAATATEIIHIRDDPVVVQPELVAIQVSRSSLWTTATDDDESDGINGGVSSSLTYESFRGPQSPSPAAVDVAAQRRHRFSTSDDGERTPTNEIDVVMSTRRNYDERTTASETVAASSSTLPSPAQCLVSMTPVKVPAVSSPAHQAPTSWTATSHASSVASPASPRPRPQIAPKPRLELRQRRASAGESSTTVNDDKPQVSAATSPTSKTGKNDVTTTSPTSPSSSTPGLAMLASVIAAASSQRMSERCRLPSSPSTSRRNAAETQVDGKTSSASVVNCARPSSASAASKTALSNSGRDSDGSQTLRTHCRTGTSSSTSVDTDKKAQCTDSKTTATLSAGTMSPAKTASTSTGDSPRRTVPPPVPPKHTHHSTSSSRAEARSVQPSVVVRSNSSVACPAVQGSSSHGPSDAGTLPFANENVGTIRQRGNASVEHTTASVNVDVNTSTAGNLLVSCCQLHYVVSCYFIFED